MVFSFETVKTEQVKFVVMVSGESCIELIYILMLYSFGLLTVT